MKRTHFANTQIEFPATFKDDEDREFGLTRDDVYEALGEARYRHESNGWRSVKIFLSINNRFDIEKNAIFPDTQIGYKWEDEKTSMLIEGSVSKMPSTVKMFTMSIMGMDIQYLRCLPVNNFFIAGDRKNEITEFKFKKTVR